MRRKVFSVTKSLAIKSCKAVLKSNDWKVGEVDTNSGTITAKRSGGLLAFGHALEVTVERANGNKVRVTVESTCLGPQLVDWGTNDKNEGEVIEGLVRVLK